MTDHSKAWWCWLQLIDSKTQCLWIWKTIHWQQFLHSYFTKHKPKTEVDSAYSSWEMLLSGVSQGSILGPLYIYISAIFFWNAKKYFAGYADNNTPYICSSNLEEVLENLQRALEQLFQWFCANQLVENAGKCHLVTSSKITNNITISITNVSSEQNIKLLGINLESRLNFDYHVTTLLNKRNKKYHALARVCKYMIINDKYLWNPLCHFSFLTVHLYGCFIVELWTI